MTAPSSPQIHGVAGEITSTALSEVLSPAQFSAACRTIVTQHSGHRAHQELDQLVTRHLRSLGFGEGMDIFLKAVAEAHEGDAN